MKGCVSGKLGAENACWLSFTASLFSHLAKTLLEQANFGVEIRIVALRGSGSGEVGSRVRIGCRGGTDELVVGANLAALRASVPKGAVNIRGATIALFPQLLFSPRVRRHST